ncbi:hypothetical protein GCM10022198_23510 [Klugiella xanthotipulae]|nr:hypothetical protein [Klugiella xanthotipulae]
MNVPAADPSGPSTPPPSVGAQPNPDRLPTGKVVARVILALVLSAIGFVLFVPTMLALALSSDSCYSGDTDLICSSAVQTTVVFMGVSALILLWGGGLVMALLSGIRRRWGASMGLLVCVYLLLEVAAFALAGS